MDEPSIEVVLRSFNPKNDADFIASTWSQNACFSPAKPIRIKEKEFIELKYNEAIKIMETANINILCDKSAPFFILGFSVYTRNHLFWIYVKKDYRKKGFGKMLFPKSIKTVTDELTKIGEAIVNKKNLRTQGDHYGKEETKYTDHIG